MFDSQLVEEEKKRNNVKPVKIEAIPLCIIKIRKRKRFLPKCLWPVKAKYYVGLEGYFLEKEESTGEAVTLIPTADFRAVYIEVNKKDCLNGYKRLRKFSFLEDASKQRTRDFINYFWGQITKSINEAGENGYLVEIGHVFPLNPNKEYQEILKREGVSTRHREIYQLELEGLDRSKRQIIMDEQTHDITKYHHTPFLLDVVESMLLTRKRIPISYTIN